MQTIQEAIQIHRILMRGAAALAVAMATCGAAQAAAPATTTAAPAAAASAAKPPAKTAAKPAAPPAASSPKRAADQPTGTGRMPLAPHVGIPGAERLGVTDRAARPTKMVDINSASVADLKTLPGVGDAEAQRIVSNRPYRVKTDLVAKKVLAEGPFMSLRHHVMAVPPPGALGAGKIKPGSKAGGDAAVKPAASSARAAKG